MLIDLTLARSLQQFAEKGCTESDLCPLPSSDLTARLLTLPHYTIWLPEYIQTGTARCCACLSSLYGLSQQYPRSTAQVRIMAELLLVSWRCRSSGMFEANRISVSSIYMSNGKCYDTCSGYAFAIVQDDNCWCSNYVPLNQVSLGNCNSQCPGYPSDSCGNSGSGLYGYIAAGSTPSGTSGASSNSVASVSYYIHYPILYVYPSMGLQALYPDPCLQFLLKLISCCHRRT